MVRWGARLHKRPRKPDLVIIKYLCIICLVWFAQERNTTTMATFTKISETEEPHISIDPRNKTSKIDDNVYAGFTE